MSPDAVSPEPIRVLEIRHAESEPPGSYSPALAAAEVTTLRIWREPAADVDLAQYDAIVVLGGAMGVGDSASIPWITDEIDLLTAALELDLPIWGVCLGAQMLAAALGAEVHTSTNPELGVRTVTLNDAATADPVWRDVRQIDTVHWHFDTFTLPPGATLLASSELCANQLYRVGRSYGVQFHLEAGGELVGAWLSDPGSRAAVASVLGDAATDRFADEAAAAEESTAPLASEVMGRWLTHVVAGARSAGRTQPAP